MHSSLSTLFLNKSTEKLTPDRIRTCVSSLQVECAYHYTTGVCQHCAIDIGVYWSRYNMYCKECENISKYFRGAGH